MQELPAPARYSILHHDYELRETVVMSIIRCGRLLCGMAEQRELVKGSQGQVVGDDSFGGVAVRLPHVSGMSLCALA